jgi:hypothetical protein
VPRWLPVAIYIGQVIIDPSIVAKLNTKHQVTQDELREALQWPASVHVAREVHPEHGPRWIAVARTGASREIIATLLPAPEWEGDAADTWVVKTARWV